ncbi:MAG: beta-ketoacyl-[acyl-carrier-protein] synthase family protein [Paludibacteraceae bacterium]|nr:beta-ketoacyl-[acyl-carrier-protein] synthase family protein [Paludibacteraceae bacterium]
MGSYVIGIGVISAIGNNVEENFDSLVSKRTGISALTHFSTSHDVPVGQINLTNDQLKEMLGLPLGKTYSRTALLGMVAVKEALRDAGVDPHSGLRIGLISSTSAGGMDLSENFYVEMRNKENGGRLRDVVSHDCGDSTEQIASTLGIHGFLSTISTACSSSANALMLADRLLNHDQLDLVVAGGIDPLCKFTINGFNSLMILDKELCRPFDATRAGLNLGEAAGFLVLQRDKPKSGKCYCRLAGYANANDAYHQTATSPNGEGPFLAMSGALKRAGLRPEDVDYVNVHGTGTGNNDQSEGTAMRRLFGEKMPRFSSTKVYTGHTLGAAGGIEAVYSALAISRDVIFPTFNFKNRIEELEMEPETEVIPNAGVKVVMSNSFGFGGNVSSLVFSAE